MNQKTISALKAKLAGVKTLAAAARGEKAKEQFNAEIVSHQLTVAASAGFDSVTISPATPLDLRATDTATETVNLLRQAGFEVEWQKRQPRPEEPETWVLMVSWREK